MQLRQKLKEKGLTINGVKKLLEVTKADTIDDSVKFGVYKPVNKSTKLIKEKIRNISNIIKDLKKIKDG